MVDVDSGQVSRVITNIYEAAYDQSTWTNAVENLCALFHGSKACLARIGPDLQPGDAVTTNFDLKFHQLYVDQHSDSSHEFADRVSTLPVGTIYNDRTLFGENLRKTRFWNEWMAPQDMYGGVAVKLMASGPSFWICDIQRGRRQPAFEADELSLLASLAPHILRAAQINQRFASMQPLASAFSHLPFGAILLDGHMRVIASNAAADAIMSRPGNLLGQAAGHLVSPDAASLSLLQRMVAQACKLREDIIPGTGGDLMMRAKPGTSSSHLSVSVGPLADTALNGSPFLQRCAVVFVREISLDVQAGFEKQVRNLFGLTAREANLAASLASGRSVKEAAKDAGIAYSTMRTYLENVFRKTETRQQSQLVALLRSLQPPIQR